MEPCSKKRAKPLCLKLRITYYRNQKRYRLQDAERNRVERHPEGAPAESGANGVRSNEALGADGHAFTELIWFTLPPFLFLCAVMAKMAAAKVLWSAKRSVRRPHQRLCVMRRTLHYASLNIIFLCRCKFINFYSTSHQT